MTGQNELWIDVGPPVAYGPSITMIMRSRLAASKASRESAGRARTVVALGSTDFGAGLSAGQEGQLHSPVSYGVVLSDVIEASNASSSGLRSGDVLTAYEGARLNKPDDLGPAIEKAAARRRELKKAPRHEGTKAHGTK